MKNEYLNSENAQKLIVELSQKMDELTVEGRTYHSEFNKSKYGGSSSGIYFYENEILHNRNNYGKYTKEEVQEHIDKVRECRFSDLTDFFPSFSKIKFTFRKGELIQAEKYDIPMLLESVRNKIENKISFGDEEKVLLKYEALIHFKKEADEIGMFVDATYHYNNSISSFEHVASSEDILSIYHQLEGKIESLYFICENVTIKAQSSPAFEEYGLQPLTVSQIELAPDYQKQKETSEECKKLRHEFFNSLGKLDERVIYLRVGGFRDHSWPENSTSHNSCKMRVIYTPESTILMTDGISDIYSNFYYEKNSEYNGIGAEFYMEFHGNIPYYILDEHFAVALVNSVSQIAIGHGDFKKLMETHGETTLEFTEDNIELWVNRDNNANQGVLSFLTSKDFIKTNSFGVLLGLESKTVPQKLQLNLEEILLVNIKPVAKKWLMKTKLRSENNEVAKEARQAIIKEFKDSGEWNLVPLTYHKEYLKTDSDSGIVETNLFPF